MDFILYISSLERAFKRTIFLCFRHYGLRGWLLVSVATWFLTFGSHEAKLIQDLVGTVNNLAMIFTKGQSHGNSLVVVYILLATAFLALSFLTILVRGHGHFIFIRMAVSKDHSPSFKASFLASLEEGWQFILFQIIASILSICLLLACISIGLLIALPDIYSQTFSAFGIAAICTTIVLILFCLFLWWILHVIVVDFIPPFMIHFRINFIEAVLHFIDLSRRNLGTFIIYLITRIGIGGIAAIGVLSAVGSISMILKIFTCCLPFISTLIMIPISLAINLMLFLFLRFYVLEFLRELSPQYNMFPESLPEDFDDWKVEACYLPSETEDSADKTDDHVFDTSRDMTWPVDESSHVFDQNVTEPDTKDDDPTLDSLDSSGQEFTDDPTDELDKPVDLSDNPVDTQDVDGAEESESQIDDSIKDRESDDSPDDDEPIDYLRRGRS